MQVQILSRAVSAIMLSAWFGHGRLIWAMFANRRLQFLALFVPRTETLILFFGLICTIYGKLLVIERQNSPHLFTSLIKVTLPDLLFFAAVLLLISVLYLARPSVAAARCSLVIAAVVSGWAILNTAWLISSAVQLQPRILLVVIRGLRDLWPIAQDYLLSRLGRVILFMTFVCIVLAYFLRHLYRPSRVVTNRTYHAHRMLAALALILLLALVRQAIGSQTNLGFAGEVLGFSSHWQAIVSAVVEAPQERNTATRNIPCVGQRKVLIPEYSAKSPPNVVLILLESVSFPAASLDKPAESLMPTLVQLAREGAEFRRTRVIVPYTTKAFWSVLTSTTPTVQTDYVEAIPAGRRYEGLPSLLARLGYRSGFFMMSKGGFECAPGFFNNLAFDWAWFRENLEDKSAYLGYFNGDDFRMIKPAFEWAAKDSKPFFLMMLTSVSHDPYDVPAWFDKPKTDPYEKYLQTIQYTDIFLARICQKLRENGLDKNTILCVLGDHGTSFRLQQGKGRWVPYEEVIRIPWVLRWPGHIEPGQCIDWPCSQLDVAPTILKLIGFDISQAGFEGKDAFAPSPPNRRLYFSSWYPDCLAGFIENNRKIVYWPYIDKVFEFDLAADPGEKKPLILAAEQTGQIKQDILNWQKNSRIAVDARRRTEDFLFSHWQTFSAGRSAWAYYIP